MTLQKIYSFFYTRVKLKLHHVTYGHKVLGNSFYIRNKGSIRLGRRVYLNSFPDGSVHRTALSTYYPEAKIEIGDNCRLNGVIIHCNSGVSIGANCMFGPGTIICDNDSHNVALEGSERQKRPKTQPIHIGNNVWVGMNCTIMKGVLIGENSIIAAGSLVVKEVPSNCLFGGHPAKLIRRLS